MSISMDDRPHARRSPTAAQMIHDLERDNPDLFAPEYDAEAITDALLAKRLPPSALRDMALFFVQSRRRDFLPPPIDDPIGDRMRRKAEAEIAVAQAKAKVVRQGLGLIDQDYMMGDGRRLGAWTIGELRTLKGVFSVILEKAGTIDDTRTVDQVMRRNHWDDAA